jgi:hypothetical protein
VLPFVVRGVAFADIHNRKSSISKGDDYVSYGQHSFPGRDEFFSLRYHVTPSWVRRCGLNYLVRDKEQCLSLMNTVINRQVPKKTRNFLSRSTAVILS